MNLKSLKIFNLTKTAQWKNLPETNKLSAIIEKTGSLDSRDFKENVNLTKFLNFPEVIKSGTYSNLQNVFY